MRNPRRALRVRRPLLPALLALAIAHTALAKPLFSARYLSYDVGRQPYSVVIGNLDGDGIPDLAVANQDEGTISILLGNGDGTFRAGRDVTTGGAPSSVAAVDLNGDGHLDLAVALSVPFFLHSCTVAVLLGNGDGTFARGPDAVVCNDPRSLAVADVNSDHRADLVVVGNTVSVLLGNGDGTFGSPHDVEGLTGVHAAAVADLNRDGKPDLAVANSVYRDGDEHLLSILIGHGDGTFDAPTEYNIYVAGWSVAAGDLDGDGSPDLAVGCDDVEEETTTAIALLFGNGDGTFRTATMPAYPYGLHALAMADLNADGRLDLVTTASEGDPDFYVPRVCVYLNKGHGTFAPMIPQLGGAHPWGLAVGDLDRDGRPDVAVTNAGLGRGQVSVLRGNGDGTFGTRTGFATRFGALTLAAADFNSDGRQDLVATEYADFPYSNVYVLLGNGDGTFADEMGFSAGRKPSAVAIADLNLDGKPDLAVANYASADVTPLFGRGDGTFLRWVPEPTGRGPLSLAIADLNGDGRPDIVVGTSDGPGAASVLLANGFESFAPKLDVGLDSNYTSSVAIGDLNADGHPDLVMTGRSRGAREATHPGEHGVAVLLGNGDGTFGAETDLIVDGEPKTVSIMDLDADGRPDIVLVYDRFGVGTISLFHGNGDGTFGVRTDLSLGGGGDDGLAILDLDGDGRSDIATVGGGSDSGTEDATVSVLLGSGPGTFGSRTAFGCGSLPATVVAADFNGDGRPDLAIPSPGKITVLLNRGDAITPPPVGVPVVPHLALDGLRPNPTAGAPQVAFTLADNARARLEVLDVAGRRVFGREVGALGAGRHVLRIDPDRLLAAGIYFIRLSHGSDVAVARGVVTR